MTIELDHPFFDARNAPETQGILKAVPHYDAAKKEAIKDEIRALLKQQDAVLVAHYYT